MSDPVLNDVERAVLAVLVEETDTEERYLYFRAIQERTDLSRDWVRCACRSLTDKKLAVYSHSLWNDDGQTAGSGYAATKAGAEFIARQETKSRVIGQEAQQAQLSA